MSVSPSSPTIHPLRILVVSDLHFGKYAVHGDFRIPETGTLKEVEQNSMRQNFFQTVSALGNIDLILVPGDLTSIACPNEFELATDFLVELAAKLKPKSGVFHTFGNHDTNWAIAGLCPATNPTSNERPAPGYRKLGSEIGRILCPPHSDFQKIGPLPGSGIFTTDSFHLAVLNSGYDCHRDQPIKSGLIGQRQLAWLEEEFNDSLIPSDRTRIVMVHHHPIALAYPTPQADYSAIQDADELLACLAKAKADILIHGHRHHPHITTQMRTEWNRPLTILCAGSFAVDEKHRARGQLDNTFHLIETTHRHEETDAACGVVRTFYYSLRGWLEASPVDSEDGVSRGNLSSPKHFGSTMSDHRRIEMLRELVDSALNFSSEEQYIELPSRNALPSDLAACTTSDLNGFLLKIARKHDLKIINDFAQTPILKKANSLR